MIQVCASALERSATRLHQAAGRALEGLAREAAARLVEAAALQTPVDTGKLRANWSVAETGPLSAVAENATHYASFVEFDTRHWISRNIVPGQRFMRDAMEETEAVLPEKVETRLREMMERALHG